MCNAAQLENSSTMSGYIASGAGYRKAVDVQVLFSGLQESRCETSQDTAGVPGSLPAG